MEMVFYLLLFTEVYDDLLFTFIGAANAQMAYYSAQFQFY